MDHVRSEHEDERRAAIGRGFSARCNESHPHEAPVAPGHAGTWNLNSTYDKVLAGDPSMDLYLRPGDVVTVGLGD